MADAIISNTIWEIACASLNRAIKLKDEIQPKDWNNGFFLIKPMKLSDGKTPPAHAKQPVRFTQMTVVIQWAQDQ